MPPVLILVVAALAALPMPTLAAGIAPPGASACSGCHGQASASVGPVIAGRSAAEIAEAMQAFRSGQRSGTVMPRIAKGFTPEESEAVARWWSEVRP